MKCSEARPLLHLDREGEADPALREEALRHARTCPRCAGELRLLTGTAGALQAVRDHAPVVEQPEVLTQHILRAVEGLSEGRTRAKGTGLSFARVRIACAIGIALVCLPLAVQSYRDALALAALEERLARTAETPAGRNESAIARNSLAAAENYLAGGGQRPLAGASLGDDLQRLMDQLVNHRPAAGTAMERLRARYPELWTVRTEDGIDARERKILATQGRALLKDLDTMITRAEALHER